MEAIAALEIAKSKKNEATKTQGQTAFQIGSLDEEINSMGQALTFIEDHQGNLQVLPWLQLTPHQLLGSPHISREDKMYGNNRD